VITMMWTWDSITFLGASLFITVYFTVKIVEARHVTSMVLEQAFQTRDRFPVDDISFDYETDETIIIQPVEQSVAEPVEVVEKAGKHRHRVDHEEETGNDTYSASAICARVKSELASRKKSESAYISKETFDLMMANTDRLFTHDWRGAEVS
jgi:hypothetical protein